MGRNTLSVLSLGVTIAAMTLAPAASFAQFPPPPPPMAAGGPPPIPGGGGPGFGGPPPIGPGGGLRPGHAGPGPRLGAAAGPRGNVGALRAAGGAGRGGPALAASARSVSINYGRWGGGGYRHGGSGYGYRGAYVAGAYAAGAHAGYAYGRSGYAYSSDCYYVYRRYRRVLVCD